MTRTSSARLGRALTITAAVSIVLTVLAAAIGVVLVGRLHHSVDDSLGTTLDVVDAVDESITVADQAVGTISDALGGIGSTIAAIRTAATTTSDTLGTLDTFVGQTLPTSITTIQQTLPTVESVAGAIDSALNAVSKIPFGPDYRPPVPFATAIHQLSDALTPLSTDLTTLVGDMDSLRSSISTLDTDLATFATTISKLQDSTSSIRRSLDSYQPIARHARDVVSATRHDLRTDTAWTRVLIVVLALALVLGQVGTLAVGRLLAQRDAAVATPDDVHVPDDV